MCSLIKYWQQPDPATNAYTGFARRPCFMDSLIEGGGGGCRWDRKVSHASLDLWKGDHGDSSESLKLFLEEDRKNVRHWFGERKRRPCFTVTYLVTEEGLVYEPTGDSFERMFIEKPLEYANKYGGTADMEEIRRLQAINDAFRTGLYSTVTTASGKENNFRFIERYSLVREEDGKRRVVMESVDLAQFVGRDLSAQEMRAVLQNIFGEADSRISDRKNGMVLGTNNTTKADDFIEKAKTVVQTMQLTARESQLAQKREVQARIDVAKTKSVPPQNSRITAKPTEKLPKNATYDKLGGFALLAVVIQEARRRRKKQTDANLESKKAVAILSRPLQEVKHATIKMKNKAEQVRKKTVIVTKIVKERVVSLGQRWIEKISAAFARVKSEQSKAHEIKQTRNDNGQVSKEPVIKRQVREKIAMFVNAKREWQLRLVKFAKVIGEAWRRPVVVAKEKVFTINTFETKVRKWVGEKRKIVTTLTNRVIGLVKERLNAGKSRFQKEFFTLTKHKAWQRLKEQTSPIRLARLHQIVRRQLNIWRIVLAEPRRRIAQFSPRFFLIKYAREVLFRCKHLFFRFIPETWILDLERMSDRFTRRQILEFSMQKKATPKPRLRFAYISFIRWLFTKFMQMKDLQFERPPAVLGGQVVKQTPPLAKRLRRGILYTLHPLSNRGSGPKVPFGDITSSKPISRLRRDSSKKSIYAS